MIPCTFFMVFALLGKKREIKYWITLCTGKIIQSSGAKKCLQWHTVSEWEKKVNVNKLHLTFKLLVSFSENLIPELKYSI